MLYCVCVDLELKKNEKKNVGEMLCKIKKKMQILPKLKVKVSLSQLIRYEPVNKVVVSHLIYIIFKSNRTSFRNKNKENKKNVSL